MKPGRAKLLVIGLDGATFKLIKPNIKRLGNFKSLMENGYYQILRQKPPLFSPGLWTTIFSGIPQEEHGFTNFASGDKLFTREDIPARFIWDELNSYCRVKVFQVPITCPPYNFNTRFQPIDNGLSINLDDLAKETDGLTFETLKVLKAGCDLVITVFTALDRIQHFHWGQPLVLAWYEKFDQIVGLLARYAAKVIIVSDHGFCDFKDSRVRTLPKFNTYGQRLSGDHHPEAIFITKGIKGRIKKADQIYALIKKELG